MEYGEATDKPHTHESVNYQNNGSRCLAHCPPDTNVLIIHNPLDIYPTEPKYIDAEKSRGENKHKKESVVPLHPKKINH